MFVAQNKNNLHNEIKCMYIDVVNNVDEAQIMSE